MEQNKVNNLKEEVKSFANDHNNPKRTESRKRKYISTWIGAFKVSDKAAHVSAKSNSNISIIDEAINLLLHR